MPNSSEIPPGSATRANNPLAVVLDLAGDKQKATAWARTHLLDRDVQLLSKAELKWASKKEALRKIRALGPETFAVFTSDLSIQSARRPIALFGVAAGARRIFFADATGRSVSRSRWTATLIDLPSLCFELLAGYLFLVPFSWLLIWLIWIGVGLRRHGPRLRERRPCKPDESLHALYLKTTLSPGGVSASGGLAAHMLGFISGGIELGHSFAVISSDTAGISNAKVSAIEIRHSITFSATRALLEISNNLSFTFDALRIDPQLLDSVDFIYQRYSRFNFTGLVLSIITGLPLLLEFNGSEVWVSKHWDPVGQVSLLQGFERLNLRAADVVFVVSEAQRRLLEHEDVRIDKLIVNPNGVNPDLYRAGSQRDELRTRLGVTNKLVVGFLGTFGPWHGATILAEAASKVNDAKRFHFLFMGDGDQRAETEAFFEQASNGVRATFTGRVARNDVPAYLDACDILVSPQTSMPDGSEFFGSPTKLFEYMSMAKAVVASRLGQLAEVIADGENGVLVEPGDSRMVADALERLGDDESLRLRLGAAARCRIEGAFTWRHNATRVFEQAKNLVCND